MCRNMFQYPMKKISTYIRAVKTIVTHMGQDAVLDWRIALAVFLGACLFVLLIGLFIHSALEITVGDMSVNGTPIKVLNRNDLDTVAAALDARTLDSSSLPAFIFEDPAK